MGFMDLFKKKAAEPAFDGVLGAGAKGTVVPMDEIQDPVFSQGILGPCMGIDPVEGAVYAPMDGTISQLADTLHAVGIEGNGVELLIHVGVDTVEMAGDGFTGKVKEGDKVTKGQLLLTMDLAKIAAAGHPATVIHVVTNGDDLAGVTPVGTGAVEVGAPLFKVEK